MYNAPPRTADHGAKTGDPVQHDRQINRGGQGALKQGALLELWKTGPYSETMPRGRKPRGAGSELASGYEAEGEVGTEK